MQDLPQVALSQDGSYKASTNSKWVLTDVARRRRVQLVAATSAWKLVGARTCRATDIANASVQLSTKGFVELSLHCWAARFTSDKTATCTQR